MVDLSFLGEDASKLSTGKSEQSSVAPGLPKDNRPVTFSYDSKKAHPEQPFSGDKNAPYVLRAVELCQELGIGIIDNLRTVMVRRKNRELCVTYREADIMLRSGVTLQSYKFQLQGLWTFDGILTEDDFKLSNGIYDLRARYNSGLQWLKNRPVSRTDDKQQKGRDRLSEIEEELANKFLPLHGEEIVSGFHQEFLKPEYMTWTQFESKLRSSGKTTIQDKNEKNWMEK